jgi:hypothetical protein
MTDKMSDRMVETIYAEPFGLWLAEIRDFPQEKLEDGYKQYRYVRQDSINAPDGLDDAIKYFEKNWTNVPNVFGHFNCVMNASRELQRIKGLK